MIGRVTFQATDRIVIEARALSGPPGGIVRYIRGLLRGFNDLETAPPLLLLSDHPRGLTRVTEDDTAYDGPDIPGISVGPSGNALRFFWDVWALPRAIRRLQPRLLHRTKPAGTPFVTGLPPTIATIYDVIPLVHPNTQTLAQRLYWRVQLPLVARTARHIVTLSETSKRSIVQRLSVPPEVVTVTLPGIDARFIPPTTAQVALLCERLQIRRPYILTVGTIEPRKNIDTLVRGFAKIVQDIPHVLVIAGRWGWRTNAVRHALTDPRIRGRVVLLGPVAPAALPVLYGGADAFVFVSRAEGFGFPPLEAMACGTPVVCSVAGSLDEIVSPAALKVNHDDVDNVADGIARIVSDTALCERHRKLGLAHSARFTWRRTAEETLAVYTSVMRNS